WTLRNATPIAPKCHRRAFGVDRSSHAHIACRGDMGGLESTEPDAGETRQPGAERGTDPGRRRWRGLASYASQAVLIAGLLTLVLRLWEKPLAVPFGHGGDSVFWAAVVKGVMEDGWPGPFR